MGCLKTMDIELLTVRHELLITINILFITQANSALPNYLIPSNQPYRCYL